jgi:hypothetical protein
VGIKVFWKTLLFGPMLSAIVFLIGLPDASYSTSSASVGEYFGALLMTIVLSYFFVFAPVGDLPGIIPMLCYSLGFSLLVNPIKKMLSPHKPYVIVIGFTLLSIFIGVTVYGVFFINHPKHSKDLVDLVLRIVIPTSAIFGLYFGINSIRKYP